MKLSHHREAIREKRMYPPPAGGGLIEARMAARLALEAATGIPRPRAGASLKHLLVDVSEYQYRQVSPARGRGPH